MDDFIVYRHAANSWEGDLARHAFKERHCALFGKESLHGCIDLAGRDARPHQRFDELMGSPHKEAGPPHGGNLTVRA